MKNPKRSESNYYGNCFEEKLVKVAAFTNENFVVIRNRLFGKMNVLVLVLKHASKSDIVINIIITNIIP